MKYLLRNQSPQSTKWKLIALTFVLAFICLVISADTGRMPGSLKAVYDFPGGDKVGHVVIYGALAFVLTAGFAQSIRIGRKTLPLAVLVLIAVTVAEEFSQSLFSARTFDLLDLACSLAGIAVGAIVANRIFGKSKAPVS